jgi:hypothetical protein
MILIPVKTKFFHIQGVLFVLNLDMERFLSITDFYMEFLSSHENLFSNFLPAIKCRNIQYFERGLNV